MIIKTHTFDFPNWKSIFYNKNQIFYRITNILQKITYESIRLGFQSQNRNTISALAHKYNILNNPKQIEKSACKL